MERLQWGILGAGHIARNFARGLAASRTGQLWAIGSRAQATADAFGDEFAVPRRYASYAALLADPAVQVVYIATPHPMHAEWAIKAAEAGKHILCEKPLTLNAAEAERVIAAARAHDVFLMEAFMYRCHPQTALLIDLLRQGVIGELRIIHCAFAFYTPPEKWGGRISRAELGGGGILDVGCYPVSVSRLLAGVALGLPFADPLAVTGAGHVGATGVDEYALGTLRFANDIVAEISCGITVARENTLRLYGSTGSIYVPLPWQPNRGGADARVIVTPNQGEPREYTIPNGPNLYGEEADNVAAHLQARQSPDMPWDDTLGNMRTLDAWRAAVGVRYPGE